MPLAIHFAAMSTLKDGEKPPALSREAVAVLMSYEWPGNLREWRNVMERAVLLCTSNLIQPDHLTGLHDGVQHIEYPYRVARELAVGRSERDYLSTLLTQTSGSVAEAARRVGMSRQAVYKILRKQRIDPGHFQHT